MAVGVLGEGRLTLAGLRECFQREEASEPVL